MQFNELINILRKNNSYEEFDKAFRQISFLELETLECIPQNPIYHPEGNVFIHSLLSLVRAKQLSNDERVWFAALVHDLGKAATNKDMWPKQYNHEALGVPIINALCDRICAPVDYVKIAIAATREHLNIHRFFQLRSIKKLALLQRMWGLTRDDLQCIVLTAKADAQGRGPLFVEKPYPQAEAVLEAYDIIQSVQQKMIRVYQNFERECLRQLDESYPRQAGGY